VSQEDREAIERAIAAAKRRNPGIEASVFNFLRDILLFQFPENLDEQAREEHTRFVLKFQQYTGPITAKGLEDTVFYIFNRLAALNEVGGEPQHFGLSPEAFHQRCQERQAKWPHTLLATSTHDTKRSEDTRARMLAISELPMEWRQTAQRWKANNRRWKKSIDEMEAPEPNEEYLLYQTLVGTWPILKDGTAAREASPEYVKRIQAYMTKALNEAKLNTSWIQPNDEWLDAMNTFVAHILEASPKNRFLGNLFPFVEEIARLGAINSLTQTLLKLTSPGVPDIYQGNEIWDFSLVDPDNRRRVDYEARRKAIESLGKATPGDLLQNWPDGRIKMFLTQKVLQFRRAQPDLFAHGTYRPLKTSGTFAESCIAFVREHDGQRVVVIAPRLSARVGFPPLAEKWKDTSVEVPEGFSNARDLFTDRDVTLENGHLRLSAVLAVLPFAVLTNAT
jgi:(1->4)-alpha-D-glucan 1-alpha-D-glucosylmutase